MDNIFEDENGVYHVLTNEEGQYSLWPSFLDVPRGWNVVCRDENHRASLEYIETHWTDVRPNSAKARLITGNKE